MARKTQIRLDQTVADFFAGIGLVSMGLERAGWKTVYALDYEEEKATAYTNQFGSGHYHTKNIAEEMGKNIPDVTLAHASFPCTDLSVAGARKGIHKGESSAFWHFVRILNEMKEVHGEGRPPLVLLENVEGLLTSNGGKDLRAVLESLNKLNYNVDLLRIDASKFVPQSRVRLFMVGVHNNVVKKFDSDDLLQEFHLCSSDVRPKKILEFISKNADLNWYFHSLPNLPERKMILEDIIDTKAEWWDEKRSMRAYNQMHKRHQLLIDQKKQEKKYSYFPAFRRMRLRDGKPQSTVEIRTDGIAGCLRTPKGGSARQILVRAGFGKFDVRLINGEEAARLMGADEFKIDPTLSLNQVLFGFGDAVCVPVLEWIGNRYFNSLTSSEKMRVEQVRHPQLSL